MTWGKPGFCQDFASDRNFLALHRAGGTARELFLLRSALVTLTPIAGPGRRKKTALTRQNKTASVAAKGGSS
jgi:hypothetical protein